MGNVRKDEVSGRDKILRKEEEENEGKDKRRQE